MRAVSADRAAARGGLPAPVPPVTADGADRAGLPGGQASSGYLVTTSRCRILLDCGPGVAYVPRGGRALLHDLGGLFPLGPDPRQDIPFHHAFTVREYRPGQVAGTGDCTLSMHGLRHVVASCGIRIRIRSGPATLASTAQPGGSSRLADCGRLNHTARSAPRTAPRNRRLPITLSEPEQVAVSPAD